MLRRLTTRRVLAAAGGLFVLTCLAWYATTRVRFATGFSARYFADAIPHGTPAITTVEPAVDPAIVRRTWTQPAARFSVQWDAFLVLDHTGPYRFSVLSDGDARLFIDERVAIETGGPGPRQATAEIPLDRGVHSVRFEYSPGPAVNVALLWASRSFGRLSRLTGLAVFPRKPASSQIALAEVVTLTRTSIILVWFAGYLTLLIVLVVGPALRALLRHHLDAALPRSVTALLMVTAGLYIVGITWGVPGQGWPADEVQPGDLIAAIGQHFSHGWWSKYPPGQFYVCALVSAPLLVWRWLDPVAFGASAAIDAMTLLFRMVTIAMAVGSVLMVYVCGRYLYSAWAAFVAAAVAALTMPVLYYGKFANVDVPYVFWFSISLVSLARIVTDATTFDFVILALTAALAVCTKDQAYGLYALPAIAIVALAYTKAWQSRNRAVALAAAHRRVLVAALVAFLAFALCQNLAFDTAGFLSHVRFITSPGAQPFRMFAPTMRGQWGLWRAVWLVAQVSLGWPAFVLCLVGLAIAIVRPDSASRRFYWLLLPILSYHVTFMAVVGYTYDRFLLPVFLVLGLAAGFVAARLERWWSGRAVVVGVLAYSLAYVNAVNVALLRDPRYDVEQWIRAHAAPDATIGVVASPEHAPRLEGRYTESVDPMEDVIRTLGFDYLVVNEDWADRFPRGLPRREGYEKLRAGKLKYRPVFEAHHAIAFAGMPFASRFEPFGSVGYSILTKLDPPMLVLKRVDPETPAPSARTP